MNEIFKNNSSAYIIPCILNNKVPSEHLIINRICSFYKTTYESLCENNKSKKREYVEPRQIIMYYLRTKTVFSLYKIGFIFHKDHATALHAFRTVSNLIETDKQFKEKFKQIEAVLMD